MTTRIITQPGRTYDHVYDPLYTVAGFKDHAKATAQSGAMQIERVANSNNYFSEVAIYPRFVYRLKNYDDLPNFVSRGWRGPDPSQAVSTSDVTGPHRFKYFRKPVMPFLHPVPAEVVLAAPIEPAPETNLMQSAPVASLEVIDDAPTRTIATQSDYREQEAQTDPYTPAYVVRPGSAPELLTLVTLSYGNGLPAGLAEVEMIERARAKRAFEAALPPITDEESLEQRREMLQEQELREWAEREQEIQKLQERRLQLLETMLRTRNKENEDQNAERIDNAATLKDAAIQGIEDEIRKRRVKVLRKLAKARLRVEGGREKRDIVIDYATPSSQVYAPYTRLGVFPDRNPNANEVRTTLLSTYEGLRSLEASLPKSLIETIVKKPERPRPRSTKERKELELSQHLANLDKNIKTTKLRTLEPPKPPEIPAAYRAEPPPVRPVTATVEPPETDEQQELAIIFLQRLIRGRAVQNVMFEGKEKRIELIRELRTMEQINKMEQEIMSEEEAQRLRAHKEKMITTQLDGMQGEILGETLDFLAKELVRFKEERRIHAIVMLAERTRREREAAEAGRRAQEEALRAKQDEQFRLIMGVHQTTVDSYLEEIIVGVVDQAAVTQAHKEARIKADRINTIIDVLEERYNAPEIIVADLVSAFLLPEVERSRLRRQVEVEQRKHIHTAHKEVYGAMEGVDARGQVGRPSEIIAA